MEKNLENSGELKEDDLHINLLKEKIKYNIHGESGEKMINNLNFFLEEFKKYKNLNIESISVSVDNHFQLHINPTADYVEKNETEERSLALLYANVKNSIGSSAYINLYRDKKEDNNQEKVDNKDITSTILNLLSKLEDKSAIVSYEHENIEVTSSVNTEQLNEILKKEFPNRNITLGTDDDGVHTVIRIPLVN